MSRIGMIGLCKIELPSATVRLTDGGFIQWGAETFTSKDAVFGTIASIEELSEGIEAEVPALEMTMILRGQQRRPICRSQGISAAGCASGWRNMMSKPACSTAIPTFCSTDR